MVKTRIWIIIIAALLVLSAAAYLWVSNRDAVGSVANIYQDGVCIRSIDLSAVSEAYTYTVTGDSGTNTILVESGRICVIDADCPDKVCVGAGWLSDSASPIVCLPHRLVIKLESTAAEQGIDSVSK